MLRRYSVSLALILTVGSAFLPVRDIRAASIASFQVLGWMPGVAKGISPASPLTVYFNQAVDRSTVVPAWSLSPAVPGVFSWGASSVTFRPKPGFSPGASYRLTIGAAARSSTGTSCSGRSLRRSRSEVVCA